MLDAVVVPVVLDVPATIKVLTSAADIPLFKVGVVPLDRIAGVPVSDTLPLLVVMFDAWVADIVVVSPAIAVVDVVPITKLEVPLPVPAPIRDLTSAADIPEFKLGVVPFDKIAGVPVSLTTPRLVRAADALDAPVPPLATDKSVPDQFPVVDAA